jgi:acetyl esterase/lipase
METDMAGRRSKQAIAGAGLACVLSGYAAAHPQTVVYGPAGAEQSLDVYRPANSAPAPLVLFVHGGGWTKGNKAGGWHIAKPLTEMGYVVASVNYRMPGQTTIGDEAADVASAAAYLLGHAAEYGIDPRRFALIGHSAGGHLVALVGTDPSYARAAGLDLSRLGAVIALDGVFDFNNPPVRNPAIDPAPAYRARMSPIDHVADVAGHPLFCLIHENTALRFTHQADAFAAALQAHGQTVVETVAPGLSHGALVGQFDDPAEPMAQQVVDCLHKAL